MTLYPELIPFHRPAIGQDEIDEVVKTLRSGWLTTGPVTARFEADFRRYAGARNALAVNSATAGLHLALEALGIGAGDEVITTPLTFCATVNTILHCGATPVLADVGPDGNIDPEAVSARVTERTRAIVPVHLAGLPCDMRALWSIADRHTLDVVEDAAHAAGARYRGVPIGSPSAEWPRMSDAVVFSFYATKNMTTGEGGMVTCPSEVLAAEMKTLCLHGIDRDAWNRYGATGSWQYQVTACGYKYNLSDLQSAVGIHQLRKLEESVRVRALYASIYNEAFRGCEEFELPPDHEDRRHAWHLYTLRLNLDKLAIDRAAFIAELHARNVAASVHFIPIPLHPVYASWAGAAANRCPRALELYPRLVSLPLYPAMDEEQVRYVAAAALEIASAFRRRKLFLTTGTQG
jgi:dTDP-4-amino-4,6-dideoxygalactose transaminase